KSLTWFHWPSRKLINRGIPALLPDLLAGRVTMALPNMSVVLPLVRQGKLRALAAISPTRATAASDLPTMDEQGLPGFDVPIWFGLMAPIRARVRCVYPTTKNIL